MSAKTVTAKKSKPAGAPKPPESQELPGWLSAWRTAFAPKLDTDALAALHAALLSNDPRLCRRIVGRAKPSQWQGELAEAEPYVFSLWQSGKIETLAQAHEAYGKACSAFTASSAAQHSAWWSWWHWEMDYGAVRKALAEEMWAEMEKRQE